MTTPETEPQPDPPAGGLVENQGVNAGGNVEQDSSAAAARSGGHPEDADEQLEPSPAEDQMTESGDPDEDAELTGAPDPRSEAGGQDSGSME